MYIKSLHFNFIRLKCLYIKLIGVFHMGANNIDKDVIDSRLDDIRWDFNALADFILSTYDDNDVNKGCWTETCTMISKVSMQLLNLTKNHWEKDGPFSSVSEITGSTDQQH